MTASVGKPQRSRDETESWLLGTLETSPLPIAEILTALEHHGSAGFDRRVDGWAELVQDNLVEAGDRSGLLKLLSLRSSWRSSAKEFTPVCKAAVTTVFTSRLEKCLVKSAGFEDLSSSEALRRLTVLLQLEKGALCHEKTWGFGVVQRVDDFYGRVTVDFDTKRGHEMALTYAGEKLEMLPPGHLLVCLHEDQDAILKMVKGDAGALVRLVLSSFGDLNVDAIKDRLVGTVLEEKQWKDFWTRARKDLKADPLVYLPPKRSDALRLLASADDHQQEQFQELESMRVAEEILKKVDELESGKFLIDATPAQRAAVSDRLAFAVWGAGEKEPVLMARALLTAERLELCEGWHAHDNRAVDPEQSYRILARPDLLKQVLSQLPAKMLGQFLDRVFALHLDLLLLNLPDLLPDMPVNVLPEVVTRLAASDNADVVHRVLVERLAAKSAGPSMVYWLLREPRDGQWRKDLDGTELLWQGLDVLARPAAGDMLRAQHLVRALFENAEWLGQELVVLSPEQREVFLMKLLQAPGWDETERRAVVAIVVKAYPELASVLQRNSGASKAPVRKRMTSWRSYRERQQQFRKLMEEEIPDNAKEIAVARSYGDLRENAEYKYAKEHQRILYLRRDETEQDLDLVQGTDFAGFTTDRAGMGTVVTVERPGGVQSRYCVLGEWDRDEKLSIISSLSRLAQMLEGHGAGDTVVLPGENGEESCKIIAVEALGAEEKAWLNG